MLTYPDFDPIAFSIGPLKVHCYGIMYLIGFAAAWLLALYRAKQSDGEWTKEQVSDLIFYCALGVILGGRIGYVLFYDMGGFLQHPWFIFKVWDGGMSFHGGLIGVLIAVWFFARKTHKAYFDVGDFITPLAPIGLGAGRLGNFINGGLYGRTTDVPWAMVFPNGGPYPRHPSEIYEFLLEGVLLFIIMWFFTKSKKPRMAASGLFLLCYGAFRFFVEFFRQPDPQLGFVAFGWMTRGQELSIPMFVGGLLLLYLAYRRRTQHV